MAAQYDADGSGAAWAYNWDALNRLQQLVHAGDTVWYEYDASGRLARRRTNGGIDRHWLYTGPHVLAELDGSLHKRVQYVYGRALDRPLMSIEAGSGTLRQFMQDELGNVMGQLVGSGGVAQQLTYDPWGRATEHVGSGNRLWWKGLWQDSASGGLYYVRNRWYDPATGRFLSEDPIGLEGGINLYQFASGDPINFSDPYGLCPESLRDRYGSCPGGLSVDEWQAVERAILEMLSPVGGVINQMLYAGKIHGGILSDRNAGAQASRSTGSITVNRAWMYGSVFRSGSADFAWILAHELAHLGQSPSTAESRMPWKNRPSELEANRFACQAIYPTALANLWLTAEYCPR